MTLTVAACSDDAGKPPASASSTTTSTINEDLAPVVASKGLPGVTERGLASAFTMLGLACDEPSKTLAGTQFDCKRESGTLWIDVAISTNFAGHVWAASVNVSDVDPDVLRATAEELMPSAAAVLAAGTKDSQQLSSWIREAIGLDGTVQLGGAYWTMVSRDRVIFFTVQADDIPGHSPPTPPAPPTTAVSSPSATTSTPATTAPATVTVPDVAGLWPEEATDLLDRSGLDGTFAEEASDTVEQGQVVRTDPPAGSEARAGDTVTVYVSAGPSTTEVPDVLGMAEADAVATLQGAGFSVVRSESAVSNPDSDGRVLAQSPEGGVRAERGSTVEISVGRFAG